MEQALLEWGQGLVAELVFALVMKSRGMLSMLFPGGMVGVAVEGGTSVVVARQGGAIGHPAKKKWT